MNYQVFIIIFIILSIIFPVSALSRGILNRANALTADLDPLKNTGVNIGSGELSSSMLPASTGLPVILAIRDNINGNILGNITARVLDRFDDFLNSRPIRSFSDAKCVASAITGGTDGITKKGMLILGTNCDDKIQGTKKDEIIYTFGGIDRAFADQGNDIIYGGIGSDRLYGEKGDDIVIAGGGDNLLDGGPGNDVLAGGAGNNLIVGGDDNDQLIAGLGTTIMDGGTGTNIFDCGLAPGKGIVLDYNPDNGDTIAGQCKIVNNIGTDFPSDIEITPPDNN